MGSQPSKPEAGGDRSLSLKSVKEIMGSFVKINVGVAEYILKFKEDKSRDADLNEIVKGYVANSDLILEVCTALKECIKRALIIEDALQKFETEGRESGLNSLERFRAAGNPFTEEFFSLLKRVHENQRELDEKLNKVPTGRTTANVIYGVATGSVLTCAAVFIPVLWGAVASLVIVPMGAGAAMGAVYINKLGKERENELSAQREIIEGCNNVGKTEFGEIESGVDDLKKYAVRQTTDGIKTKLNGFMESIKELSEHADRWERDVKDGMDKIK